MIVQNPSCRHDAPSCDGLDELLHILETGSEMALKRMAFLNRNCKTLASPHLSVSQATKLMTILADGCVSQDASERASCAELMLRRMMMACPELVDHKSILSSLELQLRASEGKIKVELLELITAMLHDKASFGEVLCSSTLLEYIVQDLTNLTPDQMNRTAHLAGFQEKKALNLAQDAFATSFFSLAVTHGYITVNDGDDATEELRGDAKDDLLNPMDTLRIHMLGERFDHDGDQANRDEEMLVSTLSTMANICAGSSVACRWMINHQGNCCLIKRCLLDKNRKEKVALRALELLRTIMLESGEAEMRCAMNNRDFGMLLFEILSLELSGDLTSAVLVVLRTMFVKAHPVDLSQALDIGLGNFLSLAQSVAAQGNISAFLEWYESVQALMASSVRLPDVDAVAQACSQGLRIDFSPEVIQACWSAMSHLSLPGIIESCTCMYDVLMMSFDVIRNMSQRMITHDGCLASFFAWVRMVLQNGRLHNGTEIRMIDDQDDTRIKVHVILEQIQSIVVVRVMELFQDVADSTVMTLLQVLTVSMDVGVKGWSIEFARTYANAGFIGTITSWLDDILQSRQGQQQSWGERHNTSAEQSCAMAGAVFLHRFLSELHFSNLSAEGFNVLSNKTFVDLMSTSQASLQGIPRHALQGPTGEVKEEFLDIAGVVSLVASILACSLFYGDQNVCENMAAHRWVTTVLQTGIHSAMGDKELAKNLLTAHTVLTQLATSFGEAGTDDLTAVLDIVSMLSGEEVICDPGIVHCLWKAYGGKHPELAAELLALWLDARTDPLLATYLLQNESSMKFSVFSNEASFPIFVSMMNTMTTSSRLLSLLGLLGQTTEQVASGLVSAGFVEAAQQVLMCSTSDEMSSTIIATLTHLLCSASSPGTQSHRKACVHLSRQLSRHLEEKGPLSSPTVIICLAALCSGHLDGSEIRNFVSRCGGLIIQMLRESGNLNDAARPTVCSLVLMLCAQNRVCSQNGASLETFLSEVGPDFALSSRRLLKSKDSSEQAIGLACTSYISGHWAGVQDIHNSTMAEESLIVCQQAMVDPDWPSSIKTFIVIASIRALLNSCEDHSVAISIASLQWHQNVAESGLCLLSNAITRKPAEVSSSYHENMRFMLPWLGFLTLMIEAGASWLPDLVRGDFCNMLLKSMSDCRDSPSLFIAHLQCWRQLIKCGLVSESHRQNLKILLTSACNSFHDEKEDPALEIREMERVAKWCSLGGGGAVQPMVYKRLGDIIIQFTNSAQSDHTMPQAITEALLTLR